MLKIAEQLKTSYLDSFLKSDDVSIFLCGGSSPSEEAFRRKLGNRISATKSKYRYSVFYPEDLFVELILGHQRQDLLTLENLLAKSVSAVVILPQSPGTFAELGAFANHPQLKNKLVVVMDSRYERSQSFITTGPVRYLRKETMSRVIYERLSALNFQDSNLSLQVFQRPPTRWSDLTITIQSCRAATGPPSRGIVSQKQCGVHKVRRRHDILFEQPEGTLQSPSLHHRNHRI